MESGINRHSQCAVPTGIQELETSVVRGGQTKLPEKGNFLKWVIGSEPFRKLHS